MSLNTKQHKLILKKFFSTRNILSLQNGGKENFNVDGSFHIN